MPYIAREDGVHFVIPSYREVLIAKSKNAIQKDVVGLSQNYGEYITFQRKGPQQYEIAFSPDAGYSLGETVWHYFNRPVDMIYCEAIPNTTEAILVIVKGGSVYLDGSFPLESIPEELVIFLTQQNNFEIYTYGDVPISQSPENGKFAFEAGSVKSYKLLDKPAFKNLPLLKAYQFQLLNIALKEQGIGVFPLKQLMIVVGVIGVGILMYSIISELQKPSAPEEQMEPNPYQKYVDAVASPSPSDILIAMNDNIEKMASNVTWKVNNIAYQGGSINFSVTSPQPNVEKLMLWAKTKGASIMIQQNGLIVSMPAKVASRSKPKVIYPLSEVLAALIDNVFSVNPGDTIGIQMQTQQKQAFNSALVTINLKNASPLALKVISKKLQGLPVILTDVSLRVVGGLYTGSIKLSVMGI